MKLLPLPYRQDSGYYFAKLQKLAGAVWLDSGKPFSSEGRFDILTALPTKTCRENDVEKLRAHLETQLQANVENTPLPFAGGWVGMLCYEARHEYFNLGAKPTYALGSNWFGWYDWALIQDHASGTCTLLFRACCPPAIRSRVETRLQAPDDSSPSGFTCGEFRADEPRQDYLRNVARIKDYLGAGDCYQVNYSQRFSAQFAGSPLAAYLRLRQTTPNPFSAFIKLADDQAILSLSPERFIQVQQRRALTEPIKGTAPRGHRQELDAHLAQVLMHSAKNRAENVMIVDLLRNDFSRNCEAFSVSVPSLCQLRSYANVHHLVSTVTGRLRSDVSHPAMIIDCFPGGSITGAPKKRAVEIINELESHPRGPYCGAIGYFSCNDNSDFNISIRTLLIEQARVYAWAGGGIVMDSDPQEEFEESLTKISSLLNSLSSLANPVA